MEIKNSSTSNHYIADVLPSADHPTMYIVSLDGGIYHFSATYLDGEPNSEPQETIAHTYAVASALLHQQSSAFGHNSNEPLSSFFNLVPNDEDASDTQSSFIENDSDDELWSASSFSSDEESDINQNFSDEEIYIGIDLSIGA
jgi:hypothetical protein